MTTKLITLDPLESNFDHQEWTSGHVSRGILALYVQQGLQPIQQHAGLGLYVP